MDDPLRARSEPRPSRRRARLVAGGIVAAVVVAGGAALMGVGSASAAHYRTAAVSMRSVDQVLNAVATIEPVSQAAVAFPVSGTVTTVNIAVGDAVSIGQPLATLDTAALEATVIARQAALDQAKLVLDKALKGETTSGTNGTGTGTGSAPAPAQTIALTTPSSGSSDGKLSAAQQAVLEAQRQVDTDLRTARQALADAGTICGTAIGTGTTTTSTSTTTSTTVPSGGGAKTNDAELNACRDALQAVLTAQQQVASSQSTLANASTTLDEVLAQRAGASSGNSEPSSAPDAANSRASSSGSNANSNSSASANSNSSSSSRSAKDLIAYQKAIDAATLQLVVAQQAFAQATITSPIAGTVAAVNLEVGAAVTSASATDNVVIVGAGGYEATALVSVDDLPGVAVGQEAAIVPDGTDTKIKGRVVSIGVTGDTMSGTTTYPVVIGINSAGTALHNGSIAAASIVTGASNAALAVPTSAVSTAGTRHTVQALDGGQSKTVTVEIGAMGPTWTEIKRGLVAGQKVVLADMNQPLPSSATDTSSNSNGGRFRGAFPGGGNFTVRDKGG
jgi:multidrug efflux pump subunit AcrA (membrane-fusion protein)